MRSSAWRFFISASVPAADGSMIFILYLENALEILFGKGGEVTGPLCCAALRRAFNHCNGSEEFAVNSSALLLSASPAVVLPAWYLGSRALDVAINSLQTWWSWARGSSEPSERVAGSARRTAPWRGTRMTSCTRLFNDLAPEAVRCPYPLYAEL